MKDKIFFDNNSTTRVDQAVIDEMVNVMQLPLNASSIHSHGRFALRKLNNARQQVKKFLNAGNYDVIFTSGATEANNQALLGGKNLPIITTKMEHPAIYKVAMEVEHYFAKGSKDGLIDLKDLKQKISDLNGREFICSIMIANNETGVIYPVKEIAKITHQNGGIFHCDLTQAVGKLDIDLEDLNIDMASLSAHKLSGPQGAGALVVRKGINIDKIIYGSGQESGKRPGTNNIAGAVGLGKACEISSNKIVKYQKLQELRDYFEESLVKIAGDDAVFFCKNIDRTPNTSFVAMRGVDNQTQLIDFDLNGFSVAIGSACSSGSSKPSATLSEIGIDDKLAKSAIRVSFGLENTKEEVNKFIEIWKNLYQKTKN
ncbi:cysteine desulfurase [Rickettsiales bacterium]|nr:cysteine desulfurase [Rickettsiales bacterium]MDB2550485.1 cysteine desulfurase [Rickettsiales bacterium]